MPQVTRLESSQAWIWTKILGYLKHQAVPAKTGCPREWRSWERLQNLLGMNLKEIKETLDQKDLNLIEAILIRKKEQTENTCSGNKPIRTSETGIIRHFIYNKTLPVFNKIGDKFERAQSKLETIKSSMRSFCCGTAG